MESDGSGSLERFFLRRGLGRASGRLPVRTRVVAGRSREAELGLSSRFDSCLDSGDERRIARCRNDPSAARYGRFCAKECGIDSSKTRRVDRKSSRHLTVFFGEFS